jgi:hypothetical protein
VLALCLLAACGGGAESERPDPVLLIGVDGLEPSVVRALVAEGRLPNIARFAEEGTLASLGTLDPTFSPAIWTTIATGRHVEDHGIDFFSDDQDRPYTSNCRGVPALWNLVSDAGRTVDVVGWWVTWPAETVAGRMVASYAPRAQAELIWKPGFRDALPDQTWPPHLIDDVAPLFLLERGPDAVFEEGRRVFGDVELRTPIVDFVLRDLAWTLASDLTSAAIGEHFLENDPADLVMVYLSLPDVAGHRLWRWWRPDQMAYAVPAEERAGLGDLLPRAYEETDRMIGRLLERAPEGATVLLVSDHGMGPFSQTLASPDAMLSGHHESPLPGVAGALGRHAARRGSLLDRPGLEGDVLGVAPTVLNLLDVPIPAGWPRADPGDNRFQRMLLARWREANPPRLGPEPEFRAPTPPIQPPGELTRAYLESYSALGYFEAPEEAHHHEEASE